MFISIHKIDGAFQIAENTNENTKSLFCTEKEVESYLENKEIDMLKVVYFEKSIRYDMDFEKIILEYDNFPIEAQTSATKKEITEIIQIEIETFLSSREAWYLTVSFK